MTFGRDGSSSNRDAILAAVGAPVDITLVELSGMLHRQHGATFAPSTI